MARINIPTETPFGKLIVKGFAGVRGGHCFWRCLCACGTTIEVSGGHLLSGDTQSCGCLRKQRTGELFRTHGMSETPEHGIWNGLKARCLNPNEPAYHNYGGRQFPELPITICDEWRDDFMAFYNHVGPRPSPKHTIERIDNSKGYEPGNVKWATRTEQARNRRSNRLLTFDNRTLCVAEWSDVTGLPAGTIHQRVFKQGWTAEQALTVPLNPPKRIKKVVRRGDTPENVRLTFEGQTECVAEWARVTGISVSTLRTRLARNWSVERALSTPPACYQKKRGQGNE